MTGWRLGSARKDVAKPPHPRASRRYQMRARSAGALYMGEPSPICHAL